MGNIAESMNMISLIYLGTEEEQRSKLDQLQEIDEPRKELDDSMHKNSKVYECIATEYPEDLKVVIHVAYFNNHVIK